MAALTVVLTHCSARFVSQFSLYTYEHVVGNLFNGVSRIGVPLFLMISGALFLDEEKEVTLKSILSKNVKSIAIITIIWATIYAVIYKVVQPVLLNNTVDIKDVIIGIAYGHYHMWYLYMTMGVYLVMPFLKKFVCKENKELVFLSSFRI